MGTDRRTAGGETVVSDRVNQSRATNPFVMVAGQIRLAITSLQLALEDRANQRDIFTHLKATSTAQVRSAGQGDIDRAMFGVRV